MVKFGPGGKLLLVLMGLGILAYTAERHVGHRKMLAWLGMASAPEVTLSAGDFPPGAAAPEGDLVTVPLRPLRVAALARGSASSLLLAAGGLGLRRDSLATRSYGLDLELTFLPDEGALLEALTLGGDRNGADAVALSVDRYAQLRPSLSEVGLKAILLLGRSRGFESLVSVSADQVPALRGKRIAVSSRSPARYFVFWELAQALLSPSDVTLVPATSSPDAARLLAEGRADAAAGAAPDLAGALSGKAGRVIASTANAPHLVAMVLVMRTPFLARYPDAARRLVRATLEAGEAIRAEPTDAARLLSSSAPSLGDPFEAIRLDPPATLSDNLAFFGVRGDAPVRYDELFGSAAGLWRKLGERHEQALPADTRDLAPLLAAAANPPTPPAPRPLTPAPPTRLPEPGPLAEDQAPRPPDAGAAPQPPAPGASP